MPVSRSTQMVATLTISLPGSHTISISITLKLTLNKVGN